MQHTPHPRFSVICLRTVPHRMAFAPKIKNHHILIRNRTKQSLDLVFAPELPFMIEQPALHYPHCGRVDVCHRAIHLSAHLGKVGRVICRRCILIERICRIEMVCTIQISLLLNEHLTDFCKEFLLRIKYGYFRKVHPFCLTYFSLRELLLECRRHMTCKCRQDRSHTKGAFCIKNLLLQLLMVIHETLWKRSSPTIKITHPEPVEISRATEETFKFLICKS